MVKLKQKKIIEDSLKDKTEDVKLFVKAQIFHNSKSRWSLEEKDLFIKMNYKSPIFYKYLHSLGFTMPCKKTIRAWYSEVPFNIGISDYIINVIKNKTESMDSMNQKCVLLIDEMSIKYEIEYDSRRVVIFGYEDLGEFGRNSNLAKHALVLMLAGINKPWKQVFFASLLNKTFYLKIIFTGYYTGNANGEMQWKIIKNTISKLFAKQIEVMAISPSDDFRQDIDDIIRGFNQSFSNISHETNIGQKLWIDENKFETN